MFDKNELDMLGRSLIRTIAAMKASKYVSDTDPHLLKCVLLQSKVSLAKASL